MGQQGGPITVLEQEVPQPNSSFRKTTLQWVQRGLEVQEPTGGRSRCFWVWGRPWGLRRSQRRRHWSRESWLTEVWAREGDTRHTENKEMGNNDKGVTFRMEGVNSVLGIWT